MRGKKEAAHPFRMTCSFRQALKPPKVISEEVRRARKSFFMVLSVPIFVRVFLVSARRC